MADNKGIRAGRAFVELFADDSLLRRGLDQAKKRVELFGRVIGQIGATLAGVGAAMRAPLEAAAYSFANMGSTMAIASARTGVTVEELSALAYAAERTGGSVEGMEHALFHMSHTLTEAMQGSSEAVLAFGRIGLSAQTLFKMNPSKAFEMIGESLLKVPNTFEQAERARAIFGRGVMDELPMLKRGAAGMAELKKQAADLGLVMSTEDADAAREFKGALAGLWSQLRMISFTIGAAVAPSIGQFIAELNPLVGKVITWTRENKGLIISAFKISGALVVTGAAIGAVGTAAGVAATGLGWLSAGLGVVGTVVGAALSPIGLAIAAVGGLGYALYKTGAAASAIDYLGQRFPALKTAAGSALDYAKMKFFELRDTAVESWDGISAALRAGDLGGAATVAFLGIKVGWMQLTEDLVQPWANFKANVLGLWTEATAFLQTKFVTIKIYWTELTGFISEEWDRATAEIRATWGKVAAGFNAIIDVMKPYWVSFADFVSDTWDEITKDIATKLRVALRALEQVNPLIAGTVALSLKGLDDILNSPTGRNAQKHLEAAAEAANGPEAQAERDRIAADKADRLAGIESDRQGAFARHQQALAEAQAELARAVAATKPFQLTGPVFQKTAKDPGAFIGAMKADTHGTFAGFAAERMGGATSDAERTRAATEATAKKVQELLEFWRNGGLQFG